MNMDGIFNKNRVLRRNLFQVSFMCLFLFISAVPRKIQKWFFNSNWNGWIEERRYDSLFVANKNGITDCFVALSYFTSFVQSIHNIIIYTHERVYFLCMFFFKLRYYMLIEYIKASSCKIKYMLLIKWRM